ncbi:MAG: hypothetical protein IPM74_15500 [Crocinitomicaceae bacterium]|nr:hypothetical protein [Crocinitomicaceae bacterium]MBK8927275.1 hypothetical protein [Crocinitomicaceae bacterium]
MNRLLLLFFIIPAYASGQGLVDGFFKGKNKLDLAISGFSQNSDKFYDGIGLINYKRSLTGIGLFAEYGLRDNLDFILNIPFINGSFQDGSVVMKYGIPFNRSAKERRITLMPALGVSFPLTDYNTESGQAIGQRALQIQPKFLFQWNTTKGLFYQVQAGYNYAFNPVPSSFISSTKIGYSFGRFYSDVWFEYQQGIGGKAWHVDAISSFRELFVTYSRLGGVFYTQLNQRFGIAAGGSYVLSGVNTAKAWTVNLSLVIKFDLKKK